MNKYIYPASFESCEEGGYTVTFPDLPGCITEGDTLEEALQMAKESLELFLYNIEDDKEEFPSPSKPEVIETEKGSFITLIEANMPLIRDKMLNKAVKKTLTIPKWLNDKAEKEHINFSQELQSALKEKLGINNYR